MISAGLPQDNLDILINIPPSSATSISSPRKGENIPPKASKWSADAEVFVPKPRASKLSSRRPLPFTVDNDRGFDTPPTPASLSTAQDEDIELVEEVEECCEAEEQYENDYNDRSVVLRGLHPHTTLADIAKVVRGGMVLNMFIRQRERTAHVAFVDAIAAEKFLIHSKRSDIYIKGKRVRSRCLFLILFANTGQIEVYWDERQHYMHGHIARRIQSGATRNLVVRFIKPSVTAESIREDLQHIHQLEAVDVTLKDGHAFISTNGVKWAVTAKTCMTSRLKYKGHRIDFYPDECDQPLPPIVKKQQHRRTSSPNKAATISHMNRFALLLEEGEDNFDEVHIGVVRRNVSAGEAGL